MRGRSADVCNGRRRCDQLSRGGLAAAVAVLHARSSWGCSAIGSTPGPAGCACRPASRSSGSRWPCSDPRRPSRSAGSRASSTRSHRRDPAARAAARARLEPRHVRRRADRQPADQGGRRCAGVSRESAGFALVVVAAISVANVDQLPAGSRVDPARAPARRSANTVPHGTSFPRFPWITAPNFLAGALVALYIHVGPRLAAAVAGARRRVLRAARRAAELAVAPATSSSSGRSSSRRCRSACW